MLDFILELLLNLVGEAFLELIGNRRVRAHPVGRVLLYSFAGVALGAASTLVFDRHFLHSQTLQLWNLAMAPVFVGSVSWLIARARDRSPWGAFFSAAFFAFAFAAARHHLAA